MAARVLGPAGIDSLESSGLPWEHCLDTRMLQHVAVARASLSETVHTIGGNGSRLALGLVIAMGALAIACIGIFCAARRIEQGTKDSKIRGSRADSVASVGSSWAWRRRQDRDGPHAAPAGSADSAPASSRRSARAGAPAARDALGRRAGGHLFVLPVGALLDAAEGGSLNISDTYSSMTLGAVASRGEDGSRKLELFLGQEAVRQCASAEAPPPGLAVRPDSFVLRGANGQHLGSLALQGDGSFAVSIRAQPQLTIDGNETDLNFRVASGDGRALATVLCKEEVPGGPEHLSIQVSPGADPVTIVTCTLAILLFVGEG